MFFFGLNTKTTLQGYYNMQSQFQAMLFYVLLLLGLQVENAEAHEIIAVQVQNEQHQAHQGASNLLLDADCAKTQVAKTQKFRIEKRGTGYYIYGAEYSVTCAVKKTQIPPVVVVPDPPKNRASLTWDIPSTREDGSAMTKDQIAGFFLYHNGKSIKLGVVNSIVIPDLPTGKHEFYIQTIDTDGLVSKNSQTVEKVI